ncbi:unnamed protein product [Cuscuta epithymum]|uniref:Uncharacterized protein n=1 Tax=Cuscuta epithymum TaxID=186058 RepID=A0AAV0DUJ4_9ASTE|nr:unnamed protein product [Cuscuta epithymum]
MALGEKTKWFFIVAGNVLTAICGIMAIVSRGDTVVAVIAAICIVFSLTALVILGYPAGRTIIWPYSDHAVLYWITWLCTIAGGFCVVAPLTIITVAVKNIIIGLGVFLCILAAFIAVCYFITTSDSS